jgi:hypothetical protein
MQKMMSGGAANGPQAGGVMPPNAGPKSGAPGAAGPPMPGAPPTQPPAAAPMSAPQDKKGLKAAAFTNLHIARNMIEEALPAFGSESKTGQMLLKVLSMLAKETGVDEHRDLEPAEILHMAHQSTQSGGGTDIQKQIRQMMAQKQQQGPQAPPPMAA